MMDAKSNGHELTDELLIAYLLGELPADEKERIEVALQDTAVSQRFEHFKLLWEASERPVAVEQGDAQRSLDRLKKKLTERNTRSKVRSIGRRVWLSAAAILILVSGILAYINLSAPKTVQLVTTVSSLKDTLPDGSEVTMNLHSIIHYPGRFDKDRRDVELISGEAFFQVSHNKLKPFYIDAGEVKIKVVGTSFNVKKQAGGVEVIVETGLVEVSHGPQFFRVRPGENVRFRSAAGELVKERTPDQLYNYYRSKEFVAEDVRLDRIVQVFNEAYQAHITIGRKELNELQLNTTFHYGSLDDNLDIISRTFKIRVERHGGQIILK